MLQGNIGTKTAIKCKREDQMLDGGALQGTADWYVWKWGWLETKGEQKWRGLYWRIEGGQCAQLGRDDEFSEKRSEGKESSCDQDEWRKLKKSYNAEYLSLVRKIHNEALLDWPCRQWKGLQIRHQGLSILRNQKDQYFPFLPRKRDQRTHNKKQNRPHSLPRLKIDKIAERLTHRQLHHLNHSQLLPIWAIHQRNALFLEVCRAGQEDQSERTKLRRADIIELIDFSTSIDHQEVAVWPADHQQRT